MNFIDRRSRHVWQGGLTSELKSRETVQKTAMAFARVQESKEGLNDTRVGLWVPTG